VQSSAAEHIFSQVTVLFYILSWMIFYNLCHLFQIWERVAWLFMTMTWNSAVLCMKCFVADEGLFFEPNRMQGVCYSGGATKYLDI
jgi:hypothetical protein